MDMISFHATNLLPLPPAKDSLSAAYRLQSAVRSHQARDHGRRLRALWPHLDELRAKYIDNDVQIQAGRVSEFYSDEALVARESLRTHPTVLAALNDAWVACSAVNDAGSLGGLDKAERGLDKANFRSMARRIYLVSVLASEREPEVVTCNRALERDWTADVGLTPSGRGRSTLSRDAFSESWFQLADLHTRSVSPSAYAAWIRGVTARIVERQGEEQTARWRDCGQIVFEHTGPPPRRSRSCSGAAGSGASSNNGGLADVAARRRRAKSVGSSASASTSASLSATATPRAGWRLQHWLSAFKAEAEREVTRGAAAPPPPPPAAAAAAVTPPLARKRRLSTAGRLLAPIQSPRHAPVSPRTPAPPPLQAATGAAIGGATPMRASLKERRRTKLRSPSTKPSPPPSQPPQPSQPSKQASKQPSPSSTLLLPPRPPLARQSSSSARAAIAKAVKARVARRCRAAVHAVDACTQLLRSVRSPHRSLRSARCGVSDCDRAEVTGVVGVDDANDAGVFS